MCSETSSPRLSFSSDLGQRQSDCLEVENEEEYDDEGERRDTSLLDMACDFEFSFTTSNSFSDKQQSSSADELFSHGIIIPTQPAAIIVVPSSPNKSLPPLPSLPEKKEKPKETTTSPTDINNNNNNNNKAQTQSKSFWANTFKRSSSNGNSSNGLNCDNKRVSALCSFPLLSRSNSTGSVPNQKKSNGVKELAMKSHSYSSSSTQKPPFVSLARSNSTASSLSNNNISYAMPQKHPLKKIYGGSYGNGVRIIPVINVPPPYISKGTAKLFGLGSFLHHNKDKATKK